ncbi:ABC transporter ATP-binding protein [Ferrimonas sp. YFM]|uniref:ABC transporter ATP-binding protein n=1 Tax=Ferrimonas sp. YFM TaxID=3028878 RepID=UPI0025739680|nr:ABC transporter ATP-binding protein [Ferrimonas sp. YFM]BDY05224.1 hemin import ATP-binding protein HmuV [Ferrimonas sp. YFM]
MAEILLTQLSFHRSGFQLELDHLVIAPGEKVALMGENGCGKSTLLSLMTGLTQPRAGSIAYGGRELAAIPFGERAQTFSLLAQFSEVSFPFTVEEVALMGRFAHLGPQGYSQEDRALSLSNLERVDMLRYRHRSYGELSGGEQRRVMLARVLNQQTPVIFLDEPSASLDVRHTLEIFAHLASLDATVVTAVHDINLAYDHFDRFLFFKQGQLLFDVPRAGVTPEILSEVYDVSVSVDSRAFAFRRHRPGP